MLRPSHIPPRPRTTERGIALVASTLLLATLLVVAVGALSVGGANVKASRNFVGAGQVHFVAESGLSAALQTANAVGVVNVQNDVVTPWNTVFGSGTQTFAALSGFTYTVTATADAAAPANAGYFRAVANGPGGLRNAAVARFTRSNVPSTSPGAIYLATDAQTNATFTGNAFTVDGRDHNLGGGLGNAPAVPGISTRNATNTSETINSLGTVQLDNVQGYGYVTGPPIVPSVQTSPAAPSVAQMNQIIDDILTKAGAAVVNNGGNQINGNATFGTQAAPQVTHFTGSSGVTIKGNGNASGYGIMIVEGDLTIQGSFAFGGLILVRGKTNVTNDPSDTTVTGNATVYGSIWTQDLNLSVGGSSIVYYSAQALALANSVAGGGALPAPLVVSTISDCSQLPTGTGGCP